jgi:hypothetical protein
VEKLSKACLEKRAREVGIKVNKNERAVSRRNELTRMDRMGRIRKEKI